MSSDFRSVMLRHPLTIAAAGDVPYPIVVFKIPAHRLGDPTFERFHRMPVQLASNFPRVHGIAAVVSRSVFNKRYEPAVRNDRIARTQFIQQAAERLYNIKILL